MTRPRLAVPWTALVVAGAAACSHAGPAVRDDGGPASLVAPATAPAPFRRIVTGVDAAGRSTIVEDGAVPAAARMSGAQLAPQIIAEAPFLRYVLESDAIWFGALPLPAGAPADPLRGPPLPPDGFTPRLPRGGFAAGIARWAPGGPDFPMHDSPTVDLVAVISGAAELRLDRGATIVRAGDVVIQRGTKHTWHVVGDEPCVVFTVLLDASGTAVPR